MEIPTIQTGEQPVIRIKADSDLVIKGHDDLTITAASGNPDEVRIEQNGDDIKIRSTAGLKLRVPREANLKIEMCSGNVSLKGVEGHAQIDRVDGNLVVKSTGPLTVKRVSGNLEGKNLEGETLIEVVDGNVHLRNLESLKITEKVSGNLSLADIDGDASGRCDGSITLRLDPQPGSNYDFSASGNLVCRLTEDASLFLNVKSAGGQARVKVGEIDIAKNNVRNFELEIGDADANLTVSAGGTLMVLGQAPEWDLSEDFDADFGEEFEGMAEEIGNQAVAQVEAQLEMLGRTLEAQLSHMSETLGAAGVTAEKAAHITEKAREASLRATERAQERMRRAQERIQHKMEQAQRKAEQRARRETSRAKREERRGFSWSYDSSNSAPQTPSEPVSEEERLMILKMLAEKKISMDEAEKLLSALEGEGK